MATNKFKLQRQNKKRQWARLLGSNWGIVLLFGVVTFLILSSILIFHKTTFFTNLDNVDQFYTWYQKLAISLHHGFLPVWNANVFSGQSFAGELQPGVFYPINILWVAIFGSAQGISELALNYLVALHFAIAAFGCYLLIKQLGARKWAAFLTGLIFAFSGAVAFRSINQTVIFFGLALLPYTLYFLAKYHAPAQQRLRWLILSGVFLGLIVLSGHIEPFFHAFLALIFFELVIIYKAFVRNRSWRRPALKSAKNLTVILASAVIIALPQAWVSSQYLSHTYRVQAGGYIGPGDKVDYGDFSKSFSLDVHEFANLIDPVTYQVKDGNDLFIGLVPLGVIILALVLARGQFKKTKLWAQSGSFSSLLLIFSAIAMLGYATWLAVVLYETPFVYQIRQLGRYSILFELALMVVLAAALEVLVNQRLEKKQRRYIFLAGAFLLINGLYLFLLRHHIFSLHYSLQTGLLALGLLAIGFIKEAYWRRLAIGILIVTTAAVNTLWFLPNIKSGTKTPSTYSLPTELVGILEQTNGKYRVELQDGTLPVNIGNVYDIQTIGGYGATIYAPYFEFLHKGLFDGSFARDLLGVELEVTKDKSPGQEVVYNDPASGVYVVKRPGALPKMFSSDAAGSTMRTAYHPLAVSTLDYDGHYQKYSVSVSKNTHVILSEIAYPGWVVIIDGKSAKLGTYTIGNIPLLKSFDVSAGTHTIELKYKPFKVF